MNNKLYECVVSTLQTYKENHEKAKEGFELSDFINERPVSFLDNQNIAHIYITGTLLSDSTPIDKRLGNTDYKDIAQELRAAQSQGAKGVMLHVNSGGGMVQGCVEVAEMIQDLPIPTVAFIEGLGCSAAYKLSVGATHIVSTYSSSVGNIGTISMMTDYSEMFERMGIKFVSFTNDGATLKSTGHSPSLSEEQAQFLQDEINEAGKVFQQHVLNNRPDIDEEVFKAGWYNGQRALQLGLVDEVGDELSAYTRLLQIIEVFSTTEEDTEELVLLTE